VPSPTAAHLAEHRAEMMVQTRSGPVPDAEEMKRYADIDPSFPERFIALAEKQIEHRMTVEREAVAAEVADRRRERLETNLGQIFSLMIALAGIGGGTYAAV